MAKLEPFMRNVLLVLRGVFAAQIVMLVALPFLTRIYPPEAFGHFQAFQSVLAIALCVAALRYELAIMTTRTVQGVRILLTLCLMLHFAMATVAAVAVLFILLAEPAWAIGSRSLLIAAPFVFLFAGIMQTLSLVVTRDDAFTVISASKVVQVTVYAVVAIALGAGHLAFAASLAVADGLSRLAAAYPLYYWSSRRYLIRPRRRVVAAIWLSARRHRGYPLLSMPAAFVNTVGGMITPMLVLVWFGAAATGQFALVERIAGMAVGAVGAAVSQVFTGAFSTTLRSSPADARALFRRVTGVHFLLGVGPAIALAAAGPWLFATVFGEQWRTAGLFARYMSPYLLIMFVAAPVNMALTLLQHQKVQFMWDTGRLAGVLGVWTIAGWSGLDIETAIGLHALIGSVGYAIYLWTADRLMRQSIRPDAATGLTKRA